jgi:opacity protein-like surface antigen
VTRRLAAPAAILGFVLAGPGVARAQSWEVSLLGGYTPSAGLDRTAPELSALDVGSGFTFGAQAGYAFSPRWTVEALYTQQDSGLVVDSETGRAEVFPFDVRVLHGGAVLHLAGADARLRPFVTLGVGATFFSGGDLPSETRLSFGLGGGLKYFWRDSFGVRAQARYRPTLLDDEDAGDFCDPFGFCQDRLDQFELTGGVVFRF